MTLLALLGGSVLGGIIGWAWSHIRLGRLLAVKRLLDRGDHALLVAHFENPYLQDALGALLAGEIERAEEDSEKPKSHLKAIDGGKDDE
jgi:hypothetical protein